MPPSRSTAPAQRPPPPATRLILALAAVHAARVAQIATLMLDDVDLGNRLLTIAGRARPIDDLMADAPAEYSGGSAANTYMRQRCLNG